MGLVAMLCSAMRGQQATSGKPAHAPMKPVPK
jgi:hypothetical protein